MILNALKKHQLLIAGLALGLLATYLYRNSGYSHWILALWLLSLAAAGFYFFQIDGIRNPRIEKQDAIAFGVLALVFIPLYFAALYTVPYQVNTDEVTIMMFQEQTLAISNVFALSDYFGFPSLVFMATGFAAKLLGGISLLHTRMVHAGMGVLCILGAFLLFRQFWKTWPAFGAAAILGVSHSLFAISRMAMRDNSGLLVEVFSFALLLAGVFKKNMWLSFAGGAVLGLSFYVYAPAKFLVFIWLAFLLALVVFRKERFSALVRVGAAMALGFFLVILPVWAGNMGKAPDYAERFSRERFLFNEEGRLQQQQWVAATTIREGVIKNIKNGLTTFNNKVNDYGYIYPNYGHGFVDPLSGILLWVGVASLILVLIKSRTLSAQGLFLAVGFFAIYLAYAFIINKSPNYTRLLIILPFFAGLVWTGIGFVGVLAKKLGRHWIAYPAVAIILILVIAGLNAQIFSDFAKLGLERGNDVGSTARYVESKKDAGPYNFYLVASAQFPYYSWGGEWQWKDWGGFFAADNQTFAVVDPLTYPYSIPQSRPLTLLMTEQFWINDEPRVRQYFTNYDVVKISNIPPLVAIEIVPSADQVP
jgi:hypothetical protein